MLTQSKHWSQLNLVDPVKWCILSGREVKWTSHIALGANITSVSPVKILCLENCHGMLSVCHPTKLLQQNQPFSEQSIWVATKSDACGGSILAPNGVGNATSAVLLLWAKCLQQPQDCKWQCCCWMKRSVGGAKDQFIRNCKHCGAASYGCGIF